MNAKQRRKARRRAVLYGIDRTAGDPVKLRGVYYDIPQIDIGEAIRNMLRHEGIVV